MRIVLDTNIFFNDYFIEGPKFRLLQSGIDKLGIKITLPKVVVDELVNKFGEELRKKVDKFEKQMLNIRRIYKLKVSVSYEKNAVSDNIARYEEYLNKYIKENGVEVLDYPAISHKKIVIRNLKRKKPFSGKGAGYRDFLIWNCILNKAKEVSSKLIFISENKGDFSDGKGNLHSDLIDDMQMLSLETHSIQYFEELETFNDAIIVPNLESLDEIKEQLQNNTFGKFSISNWLDAEIFDLLNKSDLIPSDIGFPEEYENPTISSFESIDNIHVNEVRKLSANELFISGKAELFCYFEFFIHKSDYYILDDDDAPEIYDSDWNKWYMVGGGLSKILFDFSITVGQETGKVTSVDFSISPLGNSEM